MELFELVLLVGLLVAVLVDRRNARKSREADLSVYKNLPVQIFTKPFKLSRKSDDAR